MVASPFRPGRSVSPSPGGTAGAPHCTQQQEAGLGRGRSHPAQGILAARRVNHFGPHVQPDTRRCQEYDRFQILRRLYGTCQPACYRAAEARGQTRGATCCRTQCRLGHRHYWQDRLKRQAAYDLRRDRSRHAPHSVAARAGQQIVLDPAGTPVLGDRPLWQTAHCSYRQ